MNKEYNGYNLQYMYEDLYDMIKNGLVEKNPISTYPRISIIRRFKSNGVKSVYRLYK